MSHNTTLETKAFSAPTTNEMARLGFLLIATICCQAYGSLIKLEDQPYFQGDILLPDERNGIPPKKRWINATIPYVIKAEWGASLKNWVQAAMRAYEKYTCIRFVPRTTEEDYAVFINGGACYSMVGRYGGGQSISLNDPGCDSERHAFHEMGHLIGLEHEQCSKNRDDHLTLYKKNVASNLWYNFAIINSTDTYGVQYNPLSVMHYAATSFSINNKYTMFPKDIKYLYTMGTVQTPAETDYEKIRRIYECKGTYPAAPAQKLEPNPPCKDIMTYCDQVTDQCNTQEYMKVYCPKTCGFCGLQDGVCKDQLSNCNTMLDECPIELRTLYGCHKSCGLC